MNFLKCIIGFLHSSYKVLEGLMSEFLIKDRQGSGMNYDRHNEWYAHFEGEGSGRRIVGQLKNMTYVRMMAAN